MEQQTSDRIEQIVVALADARAALASHGVHHPVLARQIESALVRAERLKSRAHRS